MAKVIINKPTDFVTALGITLLELLVAITIIGIIASFAYPSYREHIEEAEITTAVSDIISIEQDIEVFFTIAKRYPLNLSEINWKKEDPWGRPYAFLNFDTIKGKGAKRKDKRLVPINSDYDLYSAGPDGSTVPPLTAKPSRDDIVRANNGDFVGVAEDY